MCTEVGYFFFFKKIFFFWGGVGVIDWNLDEPKPMITILVALIRGIGTLIKLQTKSYTLGNSDFRI